MKRVCVALLHRMFNTRVRRQAGAVDDLGGRLAGDASAPHGRPARKNPGEHPELPRACAGRKEYLDENGVVTEAYEWFGYKFHLPGDTKHEVAVSVGDAVQRREEVRQDLTQPPPRNKHGTSFRRQSRRAASPRPRSTHITRPPKSPEKNQQRDRLS
ncbi:MAG: hypothetical protein JXA11_03530 [Phycisphaerae bacterium]|nr:hypothetical protein [Phycisphaerae bacterium]